MIKESERYLRALSYTLLIKIIIFQFFMFKFPSQKNKDNELFRQL